MASKKKKDMMMYSIDPELYARSMKPTSTVAMGMKNNQASSKCWEEQVRKEQRIAERWEAEFGAARPNSGAYFSREADLRASYRSRELNPALYTHLYDRPLLLNEKNEKNEDREAAGRTVEDLRHRRRAERYLFARAQNCTLAERYPDGPMTAAQRIGWDANKRREEDRNAKGNAAAEARELYGPKRPKMFAGGFRKPEDEDHALLLGYDFALK